MNGQAPKSQYTGVPGWETPSEQLVLMQYATQVPNDGVIVEIGAEFGMSASLFCNTAHDTVEIFSIDLFPGDLLFKHMQNLEEAGFAVNTPAGFRSRTTPIQGDSAFIGQQWENLNARRNGHQVDLLFIDGDHSYQGCKRDIDSWIPHIKSGGVVIFHDTACPTNRNPHPLHFEVSQAVQEWFSQSAGWIEYQSVDTMRIFHRVVTNSILS